MMFRPQIPSENDLERRERERMESGPQEQELSRLKTTTPQRVFRVLYTVVGIALLLLVIVAILGANVFHFW